MGRTRRVAALATTGATVAALLAFAIGTGSAATQVDPASRAIEYLQGQQSGSDGSIPVGASTDAVSEEYAIGAAAAGYDPNALRHGSGPSVMAYLAAHAAAACAAAGACGELLQAVAAAGLDPSSFGGVDLLTTLNRFYATPTGVFGDGEAFTQTLAIQGLVAVHQPVPAAALRHLVAAQDSDGGWDFKLIKNDTGFDTSDTNSTAMVLMALDAAGVHTRDRSALAWLHTQQDGDGGFPYQAGAGSDPDSTALVLQALLAAGQNPEAPTWAKGGHAPLAELIATQNSDGGYAFPGNPAPDPFTTAQVPPALARASYPLTCGSARCFLPGSRLNGPPTTPAPTPTPTRSPRPTATARPVTGTGAGSASPSPVPTGSVLGAAASPTPAPAGGGPVTPGVPTPSPTAPAAVATSPATASGPPGAVIYLIAALAAALVVAGLAVGARRLRGA